MFAKHTYSQATHAPYAPNQHTIITATQQYSLLLRVFLSEYRTSWLFHLIRSLLFPLSFAFVIVATSHNMDHEGAIFLLGGTLTASLAFGPTSTLIVKLGWSRQNREFDYWIMQPIPKLALILALVTVALFFALPGLLVTYIGGLLLLGLPALGGVMLLLLIPLVSATIAGLSAFLGSYAPNGQAATMIANIVTLVIGFLSPLFIPLYKFPLPLRILAQLLPLTYAADAFRLALVGQIDMHLAIDALILVAYTMVSLFLVQIRLDWRTA
jgi:ABC-2 type transport system permease protein